MEYRLARPDDKVLWVTGRAAPLVDHDGRINGYVGTITDVTQRKLAESERDAFFTTSLDMLCIADFEGNFRRLNPAWSTTLGYSLDELIAKPYVSFVHPDYEEATMRETAGLVDGGETVHFENRFRTKSGDYRWLSWTARSDLDQKIILAGGRDITDDKLLREELHRKNVELSEQNVRVEQATRMKSEFLANMSHELRTPLNGIIGFAELMRDGRAGPVTDIHGEFLDDILTSARHLLQLINDVLDLSKVEAGKMDFRPERVNLEQLVSEVCSIVRELATQKDIRLLVEIDAAVNEIDLDPAKLKQVLYNYISNALKFTDAGGVVVIRALRVDDRLFRLEVQDNGIGMKKYRGAGLGLALTRRIVEAQGGIVGVDSTLGEGSTFYAVLPRSFVDLPKHESLQSPGFQSTRSRTVLVVDDESALLRLMETALIDRVCPRL